MATTKNSNLFYQLYSTSNDVTSSGFVCSNAIDEEDTSFDISGDEGVITDSNGDELSSIDLSEIHEDGITLFNVETRVLQPHSAYLLQGNEYGETFRSQLFRVCKELYTIEGYEEYCNISFDILYKQKGTKKLHCKLCNVNLNTYKQRTTYGPFVELAQYMLNTLKVPVSISLHTEDDEDSAHSTIDYIKFESTKEAYDFIVRNVTLYPIMSDNSNEDGSDGNYYDSPFKGPDMCPEWLTDLFEKFLPRLVGDTRDRDLSKPNHKYDIDCGAYKDFIDISKFATDDFNTFCYELDILKKYFLPLFNEYGICLYPDKLEELKEQYSNIYYKFFGADTTLVEYNINDIVEMLEYIREYVFSTMISGPHKLLEDINKRIDSCKYPNGALRGIVIVPKWPIHDNDETRVLLVNHVADRVEVMSPVDIDLLQKYFGGLIKSRYKARLYEKAIATVKINALISEEKQEYIEDIACLPLNDITSNEGFTNSFDYLDEAGYDVNDFVDNNFHRAGLSIANESKCRDNHIGYYDPAIYIDDNEDDENIWENNPNKANCRYVDTHENLSEKVIGLYKYMHYLNDNDLWLRIGGAYMIIGKKDNLVSKDKNLLQSVLIYNPNDIPIKVKYMIFS